MLTEDQKEALDKRLEQTWTEPRTCPICGREQWNRIDIIFQQSPHKPTPASPGGPTIPLIHMSCSYCGYVLSFNAITLKLVKPLLSIEDAEEPEERIEQIGDVLKLTEKKLGILEQSKNGGAQEGARDRHSRASAHTLNLLLLGALVSLIAIMNQSGDFLVSFLTRTIWYFLAAILAYYLAGMREYAHSLGGTAEDQARLAFTEGVEQREMPHASPASAHAGIAKLMILSQTLVVLFIFNFVVHFSIFASNGDALGLREEIFFNAALLAAGYATHLFASMRSRTG